MTVKAFSKPDSSTSAPNKTMERLKFAIVLSGILIVAAAAYLSLALMWNKFSRAEVFFAECVREMLQADALVTPLYHGVPFFDKPIFSYWTIALSYKLFGISHFSARIPSIIAALGSLFITGWAGKRLFGPRAGSLSAAILASSFMFLSFANLCMSDMTLVLFDCISLSLLYAACHYPANRNIFFWLASLSLGLAFLTKGPVGIVLPGISFAAYLTLTRQWHTVKFFSHALVGIAIIAVAASPWFIAAYKENGAGALSYFFIRENLQRFAGSTYDTHKPIWFMFLSLASGFLPWSVFLPGALKKSWSNWRADFSNQDSRKQLYLWLWIGTVTLFFSFSRGKIDYYELPVYPAAAILVGNYLSELIDQQKKTASAFAWFFSGIFVLAGLGAFTALPALNFIPYILLFSGLLMGLLTYRNMLRKTYKLVFISICLTAIAFAYQIYPLIARQQAVLFYTPIIAQAKEMRIGVHSSLQNWIDEITFQTDKEPLNIKNSAMAALFLKAQAPCLLLIPQNEFLKLPQSVKEQSRIIADRPFLSGSLNPLRLLKPRTAPVHLLLVTNTQN
ncbi:MAG: glycosyltransferase family 39 protein [Candidatus Obscuribacterales bacterium]|nr:glycosyltransferase family 39 protein [Candidatus Obscuribacterales bacterium]